MFLLARQFVTGRHADYAENIGVQVEFMGLLAMIVDRVPCKPGVSRSTQQRLVVVLVVIICLVVVNIVVAWRTGPPLIIFYLALFSEENGRTSITSETGETVRWEQQS